MGKTFNFQEDLQKGLKAEAVIMEVLMDYVMESDTRAYDAKLKGVGMALEFKSDYWLTKTGNLCIERFSSRESESPGSVWQSLDKNPAGCLYIFAEWTGKAPKRSNLKRLHVFSAHALRDYCEKNEPKRKVNCKNRGYTTENWLYNLEDLKHLRIDLIEVN